MRAAVDRLLCQVAHGIARLSGDAAQRGTLLLGLREQRAQQGACRDAERPEQHRAVRDRREQLAAGGAGRLAALRQRAARPAHATLRGTAGRLCAALQPGAEGADCAPRRSGRGAGLSAQTGRTIAERLPHRGEHVADTLAERLRRLLRVTRQAHRLTARLVQPLGVGVVGLVGITREALVHRADPLDHRLMATVVEDGRARIDPDAAGVGGRGSRGPAAGIGGHQPGEADAGHRRRQRVGTHAAGEAAAEIRTFAAAEVSHDLVEQLARGQTVLQLGQAAIEAGTGLVEITLDPIRL